MSEFVPGDMVHVMEGNALRASGRIWCRNRGNYQYQTNYLILPIGERGADSLIAATHDQLLPAVEFTVANENHRAAGASI
jgi:hypothetical protein